LVTLENGLRFWANFRSFPSKKSLPHPLNASKKELKTFTNRFEKGEDLLFSS
jgi:hypothetical protein